MTVSFKNPCLIALAITLIVTSQISLAAPHNGFDLSNSSIAKDRILSGGPAKDGIPALDKPLFIAASAADFLQADDRILGIELNGVSRAYPIAILNWHEIVNDHIGQQAFVITYCPLCGTGIAFSAQIQDKTLDFGVSGLLYNSDVLLYDRQTESLWSQIKGQAISGKLARQQLQRIRLSHTSWSDWLQTHPHSQVLSDNTGYRRDYSRNPYAGYENSTALYTQVSAQAPAIFHPKERVLGLEFGNQFKAYPLSEIDKSGQTLITDEFAGQVFQIHWNSKNKRASITDSSGNEMAAIEGFWFAWFAFHPQTEVFRYRP